MSLKKEKLIEALGTKLADKVDGVEVEIHSERYIRITMIDGKVDVETKNLKTKIRLVSEHEVDLGRRKENIKSQ